MIEIIESRNVRQSLWESIMSRSEIKDIFQSYEWGCIMKEIFGFDTKFLLIFDDGEPLGGFLFIKKHFIKVLPIYEAHGGPLLPLNYYNIIPQILSHITSMDNPFSVIVRPSFSSYKFDGFFKDNNFSILKMYTIVIDLTKPRETLWKQLKKQARWGIKKAQKMGVNVFEARSRAEWNHFFEIYSRHCKEHKIAKKPKLFFDYLFEKLYPKGKAVLFLADYHSKITDGAIFLVCGNRMYYYISSRIESYSTVCGGDALMWSAIGWGKQKGVEILDLMDLGPERNQYYGINFFKKKWGGHIVERSFYIKGKLYRLGAELTLRSDLLRRVYESFHEVNIV